MAKQITITAVCDNKTVHGAAEVPATNEHVLALDGDEVQVDLCHNCEMNVLTLYVRDLMSHGAPVEHEHKPKRRRPVGLPTMCPIDGTVSKSRAGLGQHLKQHHNQRFSQFPGGLKSVADYEGLAHSPA